MPSCSSYAISHRPSTLPHYHSHLLPSFVIELFPAFWSSSTRMNNVCITTRNIHSIHELVIYGLPVLRTAVVCAVHLALVTRITKLFLHLIQELARIGLHEPWHGFATSLNFSFIMLCLCLIVLASLPPTPVEAFTTQSLRPANTFSPRIA